MDHGRLGGGVAEGRRLAERADAQAGDRGGHDDARGVGGGGAGGEERGEPGEKRGSARRTDGVGAAFWGHRLLNRHEDALDVQVHDLPERRVRVRVELLAPRRARVRQQDVHMVCRLGDLGDQPLDLRGLGRVRGDGDGLGAGALVRQRVKRGARGRAGVGLARRDVYLGAAGLEESVYMAGRSALWSEGEGQVSYPEAACKPSPREPPVTTATLPSREKMFLKSLSST